MCEAFRFDSVDHDHPFDPYHCRKELRSDGYHRSSDSGSGTVHCQMVESSLLEVDHGVIEAAQSMGANLWTIIWKVMLAESRTSLLVNATIALGTILGYSAMAGAVGGGGLGDIAIRYGYYRYQTDIMLVTVVLLVLLVQLLQYIGMTISKKLDKRTR